jgi:hypothetical protein
MPSNPQVLAKLGIAAPSLAKPTRPGVAAALPTAAHANGTNAAGGLEDGGLADGGDDVSDRGNAGAIGAAAQPGRQEPVAATGGFAGVLQSWTGIAFS